MKTPDVAGLIARLHQDADEITCYASTTSEYRPNVSAALEREAAAALAALSKPAEPPPARRWPTPQSNTKSLGDSIREANNKSAEFARVIIDSQKAPTPSASPPQDVDGLKMRLVNMAENLQKEWPDRIRDVLHEAAAALEALREENAALHAYILTELRVVESLPEANHD